MPKKPIMTLLSTAAMTALAAMSFNISTVVAAPAAKSAAPSRFADNLYIVQLAEQPVTAYKGGIKGLQATKPRKGQKIDPNSPAVVNYRSFLESRQQAVLGSVGGSSKVHSYVYVYNGFAADLTSEQAQKLAQTKGVLSVSKNEFHELVTATTPQFLGLTDEPGGAWTQTKGEGVIIGIVDSGVWPEHPSFSDRTGVNGNATKDGKLGYQQIPGWHGKCVPGEEFNASNCNQKLIGARFYNAGFGGNAGIDADLPFEFNSPRDHNGHGTHTATTAGGNANVPATGPAAVLGSISGIAPRARIAAYKACWSVPGTAGSCAGVDLLAAIDQAVADGVDVINYSISGTRTNFRDPVEIAFLFAADAGVFVAASAGNSGPASSTVAHPSPWITTVAAGTHNRDGAGSVTLGDGATYSGASLAETAVTAPFIDSTTAGLPGADLTAVALCFAAVDNGGAPVLDPAKVAGKIVLCDRGITARVNKSLAVQEAGGVGMVLTNTSPISLNADFHFVPSVHLQDTARAAVKAYAATPGATATVNKGAVVLTAPAPFTASFSSRGPLQAGGGDLLKPDLIAPGQDILAGVAPPNNGGKLFDLYSGTSMSSPHVAGLAALFKQKYPSWSPMAVKSALMTTGYDVLDGGTPAPNTNPVLIFRQGAGHVQPNSALDPGLVYDSNFVDWLSFICGAQPGGGCTGVTPIDPSDLNQASIAIGDLAGVQTVTRKLKNVSGKALTVNASVTGLAGFATAVSPTSLTLAPGQEKSFTVTFTRGDLAPLNAYTGGQLYWTGGGYTVRSPIVVRPVVAAVPSEVSGNGVSGSTSFEIKFGYDGDYTAGTHGLNPATTFAGNVADDPNDSFVPGGPGTVAFDVVVPAGTALARFQLFDEYTDGNDDLDLYVYRGSMLVGSSGGGTSAEVVNLVLPTAATYTVYVHGWETDGPDANFTLFTWNVGLVDDAGNMTVTAPASATVGAANIDVAWSGLSGGTKYLGAVSHTGPSGLFGLTTVSVATD
jgi:subtilisin family serine protease